MTWQTRRTSEYSSERPSSKSSRDAHQEALPYAWVHMHLREVLPPHCLNRIGQAQWLDFGAGRVLAGARWEGIRGGRGPSKGFVFRGRGPGGSRVPCIARHCFVSGQLILWCMDQKRYGDVEDPGIKYGSRESFSLVNLILYVLHQQELFISTHYSPFKW